MVAVDIAADYDGAPLSVLSDLIRQRQKYLGESAADAVVATGIDALNSLRALTKVAGKMIPRSDVRFGRSDPQYITGTKGSTMGFLLRRVVYKRWFNNKHTTFNYWQVVNNAKTDRHGNIRVRATGKDLTAAWHRVGRIKNRGLARRALGIAMNRLSTRQVKDERADMRLARIAAANVMVRKTDAGGSFMLQIRDGLGYAVQALQGGPASIDLALKRAANKIAGRLCKVAERKFGERVATPFPEVKGRRAR